MIHLIERIAISSTNGEPTQPSCESKYILDIYSVEIYILLLR